MTDWHTGPLDRSAAPYTHLIRAQDDPERSGTDKGEGRGWGFDWKRVAKIPVEKCMDVIVELLADGEARTFNRICVELFDKTADVMFKKSPDHALWRLVVAGAVEHTLVAPILFRNKEDDMGMKARPNGRGAGSAPAQTGKFRPLRSDRKLVSQGKAYEQEPVAEFIQSAADGLIHNALAWSARNGFVVKKGGCSNCCGKTDGTICCVCAPILFRDQYRRQEDADVICAGILGVPCAWLVDYVTGFDGDGAPVAYPEAFKLGKRMARKHRAKEAV